MLSKIKLLFWLIILLLVAYFVAMNSQIQVVVNLIPGYQTMPLPLSLVIIFSIIIGAVLVLILAITDWINFKLEWMKIKKEMEKLRLENENLKSQLDKIKSQT
ncbi:hypothetical protein JCM14244_07550 [Venenivibrio stagnispumantis]|uniref:Lipopolysaccharide assembly protein A domain-containing protein n=1 Tax=Venenivibrio stagnispumantis TaxID=407998 RepID=A0AA45WNL4_9AQUI|nr:LapA family protein [Venenivibrio stagnispumantis]MCW4573921.1 LapA family protein [Venenivibrio stagnispumantis]SMP18826.1 Protein of unknown function [Venenivibrio stagnispumantis]